MSDQVLWGAVAVFFVIGAATLHFLFRNDTDDVINERDEQNSDRTRKAKRVQVIGVESKEDSNMLQSKAEKKLEDAPIFYD